MNRKRKLLVLVVSAILLISTLTTIFATVLSADTSTYYGNSSYIELDSDGKLYLDKSKFFNDSVIYKLPDSVSMSDELSLIIEMPGYTVLDYYYKSKTDADFQNYANSVEADSAISEIESDIEKNLKLLDEAGVEYTKGVEYSTLLRGFEITVLASEYEKVCDTLGKTNAIHIGDSYERADSEVVTNTVKVYESGIFDSQGFGYDGSGIVVAVLDTGLDYYHSAFSTANFNPSSLGLTFEELSAIVNKETVMAAERLQAGVTASDLYINEKVPFGFDYADGDSEVFPIRQDHGTHVAGIIAGKNDEITGVAPNAQLAIMKIFSDTDDQARASWIIAALEDCVNLGVDVINMSIGTSCGFSTPSEKELESRVYEKIDEMGMSLIVAASNSFNSAYGSDKNGNLPLTSNPDSATIGSPATYNGSLCVASISGTHTSYLTYKGSIVYFIESTDRVSEEKKFVEELLGTNKTELELEYVKISGAGRTADYTGVDVKGKIALVSRGSTTFEEKAMVAEKQGAAAVIIYNNVSGDIKMNVGDVKIPVCSISQDDGELLAAAGSGKIKIAYSQAAGPFMSDFSSWGPGPDLEIKPEITAHGGSIYSSVPGEDYDTISGTSMATPNISGVAALLRQYVIENFPAEMINDENGNVSLKKVTAIINRLMMSTADIVLNKNGLPYAVRKQGAGLANLFNCSLTNAYILTYDRDDGSVMDKSKIELGDDPAKTGVYKLKFSIDNFGDTAVSYNLSAYVMTEGVSETKTSHGETTVTEEAYILGGAKVEITGVNGGALIGNNISISSKSTADVEVTITLSDADKKYLDDSFENGMYVEGFVVLDATSENTVDLSVPYLAFYGDWTVAPLFDLTYFDTNKDELDDAIDQQDKTLADAYATRPIGGIYSDFVSFLGTYYYEQDPTKTQVHAEKEHISLSNQEDSINSLRYVWGGLLRNAKTIDITITDDATGEIVFNKVEENVRKAYGDGGPIHPANIEIEFSAIEQNLKNNTKYTVTLTGLLDYDDGGKDTNLNNTFSFPLYTDFEAPAVTGCEFYTEYDSFAKKTRLYAKVAVYDNHYTMSTLFGYTAVSSNDIDGNGVLDDVEVVSFDKYMTPVKSEYNSTSYVVYELTDYIEDIKAGTKTVGRPNTIVVTCFDYALNQAIYEIGLPDEYTDLYFGDKNGDKVEEIILSPNEVYTLAPLLYPNTEWPELLDYRSDNESVIRIVGNEIIALKSGTALLVAEGKRADGTPVSTTVRVKVLKESDDGYKNIDKPVVKSFKLTGYYVNKAFYFMSSEERDIGTSGDIMKFAGDNYSLKMYPAESVTINTALTAYFPSITTVEFASSNDNIVKVSADGRIEAVAEGAASVTAKVLQNGKSTYYAETINIEVKDPYANSGPTLTSYFGRGGKVIIPETLAVTEIGQFAFTNYNYCPKTQYDIINDENPESTKPWYLGDDAGITEIVIPEGIEVIGSYAFAGLDELTKVTLPKSLKKIEVGAFYNCTKLKEVVGIENVQFFNQSCFANTALQSVKLDNAIAIADYAFSSGMTFIDAYDVKNEVYKYVTVASKDKKLTKITLSDKTQSIGAYAFAGNEKLATVSLAASKLKIGQFAFMDCGELTSISVNAAVIPTGTFYNCKKLATVTLGRDVAVVGEFAFGNTSVASFGIAAGNTTFVAKENGKYLTSSDGKQLLLAAPTLTSLTATGVTSVGNGAFSGNEKLVSVNLPEVTDILGYAFANCTSLTEVIFSGDGLNSIGNYSFQSTALSALPKLSSSLKIIGDYAFSISKLESVSIPAGLTVGAYAFEECDELHTVVIGNNVILGEGSFSYNKGRNKWTTDMLKDEANGDTEHADNKASNEMYDDVPGKLGDWIDWYIYTSPLHSLTIGDNVTIGNRAFFGASELEKVTLGAGAKIRDEAFYNATNLKTVNGLNNAFTIGNSAFYGDYLVKYYAQDLETDGASDTNIVYSSDAVTPLYVYNSAPIETLDLSSLLKLGEQAFAYNRYLTTVTLGKELTDIPYGAFYECSSLTTVNGLENVEVIGNHAFVSTKLVSAVLTSVKSVGDYAFLTTDTLTSVTFGNNVESIGEGAFSYCESLANVIGLENVKSIGNYAFAYTAITSADLTAATHIGEGAFTKDSITVFTLKLGENLVSLGDNPFAFCKIAPLSKEIVKDTFNGVEYKETVYTYDISDTIKVIDGSIYQVVPKGLELITYCGNGGIVNVADKTVRISSLGFAGSDVANVVLPYTVASIGHKAFFGCEKLVLVNFSSYYAPILEEEYDYMLFYNGANIPAKGEGGLNIIDYFMWNVTSMPSNVYYGANFIDYVGLVDKKMVMVRPSNGHNYDSFVFSQYFDTVLDGAVAADNITLLAIEAISKIPENSSSITLGHKDIVAAARAAYDKIVSDEQRALISTALLTILKNAEQMIEDLEYLANGEADNENVTDKDESNGIKTALIVLIVIVSVLALAIIALGVFIFIFVRKLKKGEISVVTRAKEAPEAQVEANTATEAEATLTSAEETLTVNEKEQEDEAEEEAPEEPFEKRIFDKPVDYDDITEGFVTNEGKISRRKIILIASLAAVSVALVVGIILAIINANKSYYDTYDKEGYTVSVAFDSNGGTFKGSKSSIVDLFNPEEVGEGGIALLAPDDTRRDKNNVMQVTNPGYFLAGWYTERTPIDENNPEAGYTYSGKWDFESNRLYVNNNREYSADEPVLTLYAAWVPYYNFEIYTTDESGNSYLLSTVSALNLTIPEWHDGDVTLGMDNFPARDGYTLVSVDWDADSGIIETQTEKNKVITGKWDEETATSLTPTIKLHTEWKEGKTYKIYSVNDFIKNADLNGYYELYTDLDFTNAEWPTTFVNGEFNGKIFGRNHTISGVSFDSTSRSRLSSGLFSSLGENAYIENVTFKKITHTIDLMAVAQNSTFGLLAGSAADGASFKNVKVSGSLVFGDNCANLVGSDSFTIKTVIGNGDTTGITVGEITAVKKNVDNTAFIIKIEADGSVSIVSGS